MTMFKNYDADRIWVAVVATEGHNPTVSDVRTTEKVHANAERKGIETMRRATTFISSIFQPRKKPHIGNRNH